jgi:hypothetical protein
MLSDGCYQICDAPGLTLRFDNDAALVVGDVADEAQPMCGPVNEWPEPHTLHDALDPDEHADWHDVAPAAQSSAR